MRAYRALLRALPRELRERHGHEMERVFREMLAEARYQGRRAVLALYGRSVLDVVRAWRPRVGGARSGSHGTEDGGSRGGRRYHATADVRGEGGVGMIDRVVDLWIQDGRAALRGLVRAPASSLAAVITLALGIGAITAVFSVVNGVVRQPLPYPAPEELVVLYNAYPTLGVERGSQSPGDLSDYREQADLLRGFASISTYPQTIVEDGRPRRLDVALVTPGFLSLLGVALPLGRDITTEDDHDVALVSHAYWLSRLDGDPSALGRRLDFEGAPKTVIGVLPAGFGLVLPGNFGVDTAPEVWTPIPAQGWGRDTRDRTAHWMNVVARLAPGASLEQARQEMDAVAAGQRELLPRRAERDARIAVVPLHDEVVRTVRPALMGLLVAAGMVLMIACANVANLLLVRAQSRRGEMGIRKALGASRSRVLRQLLAEGLVLSAGGAALGLASAWLGTDLVLDLAPSDLPRAAAVGIDPSVMAVVAAVAVGATVLFSAAPILHGMRMGAVHALRGGARSGRARLDARLSSGLIVFEVAVCLVLLTGGGLLLRSLSGLTSTDPGIEAESVLTFRAPLPASRLKSGSGSDVRKQYHEELERVLGEMPGVTVAGSVFPTPLSGTLSTSTYATPETVGNEEGQLASSQLVTPSYFESVGIDFVAGRNFRAEDQGDRLIVDRRMAELIWPGRIRAR